MSDNADSVRPEPAPGAPVTNARPSPHQRRSYWLYLVATALFGATVGAALASDEARSSRVGEGAEFVSVAYTSLAVSGFCVAVLFVGLAVAIGRDEKRRLAEAARGGSAAVAPAGGGTSAGGGRSWAWWLLLPAVGAVAVFCSVVILGR